MIETEVITQTEVEDENLSRNVCVVILQVENNNFKISTKPYDIKLMGKTMTEWVANSVFDAQIKFATINFNDDFLPVVKRVCNPNCTHTFVLFSDTPLFERKTYLQILQYVNYKKPSVLKLTRGYVFETDYLLATDKLLAPQTQYFEEEDFMLCCDLKQTSIIADILRGRIVTYFNKNGVYTPDPSTVTIEADCQIEPDCVLKANVQISGSTIVERGAIVEQNSIVESSVICENSIVDGARIENSFVGKNCKIGLGCIIKNGAKIEDGVVLPPYVVVDGVVVTKENNLKSFKVYKSE